jgi:hypothetical protein
MTTTAPAFPRQTTRGLKIVAAVTACVALAGIVPLLNYQSYARYAQGRTESCQDSRRYAILNGRAWSRSSCEAEFDRGVCGLVASGYPGHGYHPDCPKPATR